MRNFIIWYIVIVLPSSTLAYSMAKLFLIISILWYISMILSVNISPTRRKTYDDIAVGDEKSEEVMNNTIGSDFSVSNIDRCIPVRAVRELGCSLSKTNLLFKEMFPTVCEQHQLSYT